jgi:hypothetical protein
MPQDVQFNPPVRPETIACLVDSGGRKNASVMELGRNMRAHHFDQNPNPAGTIEIPHDS